MRKITPFFVFMILLLPVVSVFGFDRAQGNDSGTFYVDTALDVAEPVSGSYTQAVEDFETGDFSKYGWHAMAGNIPWTVSDDNPYEGIYAARPETTLDNEVAALINDIYSEGGNLSFWMSVDSEAQSDYLFFFVDGELKGSWSGAIPYTQRSYYLSPGNHNLMWLYQKDEVGASGNDTAWLDEIVFPSEAANQAPSIEFKSVTPRNDGTGYIDIVFVGKDPDNDTVTWYQDYCSYTPGPAFDTFYPLLPHVVVNDPANTAVEPMTFSAQGTEFNLVVSTADWDAGTYKVRLKVEDADFEHSNYPLSQAFTIEDLYNYMPDAPTGISPYQDEILSGDQVTLQGSAYSDAENNKHLMSFFRVKIDHSVYGRQDYDDSFSATVASGDLTRHTVSGLMSGLQYVWQVAYVDAKHEDAGPENVNWSPEYIFKVGQVDEGYVGYFAAGEDLTDYRLISFTHWPVHSDAQYALGFTDYGYDFRLGCYDPLLGYMVEYDKGLKIVPGQGYWFLSRNGANLTLEGVPVSLETDIEISLKYNASTGDGWNIVASPNDADYYWDDIQVVQYDNRGRIKNGPEAVGSLDLAEKSGLINTYLYDWSNGAYFATNALLRNQGYYVKALAENVALIFAQSAQQNLSGTRKERTRVIRIPIDRHMSIPPGPAQ